MLVHSHQYLIELLNEPSHEEDLYLISWSDEIPVKTMVLEGIYFAVQTGNFQTYLKTIGTEYTSF